MIKSPKRKIPLAAAVMVTAISLVAMSIILPTGNSLADNSGPVDREFTIWARQFEFTPAVIEVQQGDLVRLNMKSADVTHGFYIDGYDVDIKVHHSDTESVEFIADKAGTFRFRCSTACGPFHPFMAGKLVVRQSPDIIPWAIIAGAVAIAALSAGIPASRTWRSSRREKDK